MTDKHSSQSTTYKRPKLFGKVEITKEYECVDPECLRNVGRQLLGTEAHTHNRVYLRRWYLIRIPKLFSIRIHHILEPDLDRDPHDHPWPFISILLKGGYRERWTPAESYDPFVWDANTSLFPPTRTIKFINRHSNTDLHQIVNFFGKGQGVWTLFLTGPETRVWGFRTPKGWVAWPDYDSAGSVGPDPGEC